MSYCRWVECDLYVYADCGGGWTTHVTGRLPALPHSGESFNDPTPGECADRLEALRADGYDVPDYAIEELREDAILDPPARDE